MSDLAAVVLAGVALGPAAEAQVAVGPITATAEPSRAAGAEAQALLQALASSDPSRAEAADAAIVAMGEAAVEPLLEAVTSSRTALRRRAASVLGRLGDRRAAPVLARALATLEDEEDRLIFATALCRLGEKDGIPHLILLLESGDRATRLRAAIALGRFTHRDFGFVFDETALSRASAVARWREWWKREKERFRPR
jgi:HEAT repeat protein